MCSPSTTRTRATVHRPSPLRPSVALRAPGTIRTTGVPSVSALAAGVTLGARRLLDPYLGVAAGIALLLVLLAARLERSVTSAGAADRALVGAAFGIALPLFAYAVVARASEGRRWDHALDVLARHGLDRRLGAFGSILSSTAALTLAGFRWAGSPRS